MDVPTPKTESLKTITPDPVRGIGLEIDRTLLNSRIRPHIVESEGISSPFTTITLSSAACLALLGGLTYASLTHLTGDEQALAIVCTWLYGACFGGLWTWGAYELDLALSTSSVRAATREINNHRGYLPYEVLQRNGGYLTRASLQKLAPMLDSDQAVALRSVISKEKFERNILAKLKPEVRANLDFYDRGLLERTDRNTVRLNHYPALARAFSRRMPRLVDAVRNPLYWGTDEKRPLCSCCTPERLLGMNGIADQVRANAAFIVANRIDLHDVEKVEKYVELFDFERFIERLEGATLTHREIIAYAKIDGPADLKRVIAQKANGMKGISMAAVLRRLGWTFQASQREAEFVVRKRNWLAMWKYAVEFNLDDLKEKVKVWMSANRGIARTADFSDRELIEFVATL